MKKQKHKVAPPKSVRFSSQGRTQCAETHFLLIHPRDGFFMSHAYNFTRGPFCNTTFSAIPQKGSLVDVATNSFVVKLGKKNASANPPR